MWYLIKNKDSSFKFIVFEILATAHKNSTCEAKYIHYLWLILYLVGKSVKNRFSWNDNAEMDVLKDRKKWFCAWEVGSGINWWWD